jgi:hypothetical protein
MRDDGYTLAECLVALFVISLTAAGLAAGALSIGRLQASAARAASGDRLVRAVHENLSALLDTAGPFPSNMDGVFEGSATAFEFACNDPNTTCGARIGSMAGGLGLYVTFPGGTVRALPLPGVTSAEFSYAGTRTLGSVWPAQTQDPQSLSSVGLVAETALGSVPITSARVWLDQAASCQFDAISQTCRGQTQ